MAALYLVVTLSGHAAPVQLPRENLKCDIPDDWTYEQGRVCLLRAVSPYGTQGLLIDCKREPLGVTIDDPKYTRFVLDGFATELQGGVTNSGYVLMNNVRYFFVDGTIGRAGTTTYFHNLFFLGNGLQYTFTIFKADENPMEDQELASLLQSCDFINAPQPHTGTLTFWDIFHPVDLQQHSMMECFLYAVETCVRLLFIFLFPLLLYLGVTVFFYRLLFKKSRASQPLTAPAGQPPASNIG